MTEQLIYCQRDIPKEQWRYGLRSSAAVGCGWIAVYNALHLLGEHEDPQTLIRYFERQLPLIHGNGGTMFWGPAVYFLQKGYRVQMSVKRKEFDRLARESQVSILFYRWRNKLRLGAHFVALHHTQDGFIGYNTYTNSKGPDRYGESLEGFLTKRKYYGAVLLCIGKRTEIPDSMDNVR